MGQRLAALHAGRSGSASQQESSEVATHEARDLQMTRDTALGMVLPAVLPCGRAREPAKQRLLQGRILLHKLSDRGQRRGA